MFLCVHDTNKCKSLNAYPIAVTMVLDWVITHALSGSVWSLLELPTLTVLCRFPAFSLAFYVTSCHSFALLPGEFGASAWGHCVPWVHGPWGLPVFLPLLDPAMISLAGKLRNFMVRKQSHPWCLPVTEPCVFPHVAQHNSKSWRYHFLVSLLGRMTFPQLPWRCAEEHTSPCLWYTVWGRLICEAKS